MRDCFNISHLGLLGFTFNHLFCVFVPYTYINIVSDIETERFQSPFPGVVHAYPCAMHNITILQCDIILQPQIRVNNQILLIMLGFSYVQSLCEFWWPVTHLLVFQRFTVWFSCWCPVLHHDIFAFSGLDCSYKYSCTFSCINKTHIYSRLCVFTPGTQFTSFKPLNTQSVYRYPE